jgi:hypothetical protein
MTAFSYLLQSPLVPRLVLEYADNARGETHTWV